jgi:hypothetical protein
MKWMTEASSFFPYIRKKHMRKKETANGIIKHARTRTKIDILCTCSVVAFGLGLTLSASQSA